MSSLLKQVAQPRSDNTTFIYALVDPRNQAIRYIGKSIDPPKRFTTHLSESSLKKNSHKNHWIKSLLKLGLKPVLEIIDEVDYRDDWTTEEKVWIARIRSLVPGYPILTNAGDGGEGIVGCVMPEYVREKIRAANRGVPKSAEARIQFSKGQRNRWANASREERKKLLKNLRTPWLEQKRIKRSMDARSAHRNPKATSRYRNVVKLKNRRGTKCWRAACVLNGKFKLIGLFYTEIEAARERDRFVLKHIGEGVPLNFPRSDYD